MFDNNPTGQILEEAFQEFEEGIYTPALGEFAELEEEEMTDSDWEDAFEADYQDYEPSPYDGTYSED